MTYPTISGALVERLELAEGRANAAMVEARARLEPSSGATWIAVGGALAMFDGVGSPITQTFGIGLAEPFSDAEFAAIETFFDTRGAATSHEVSAHAAGETTRLLPARGYTPIEQSTVLVRPTALPRELRPSSVTVRRIEAHESALWSRISGHGWSSVGEELSAFIEQFGRILSQAHGVTCFLAEIDGAPIAAAAMNVSTDVALLAGASTIPSERGRGAQAALLDARLTYAQQLGVELAMVVTAPDSTSQHNAERSGFRPLYGRTKWERPARPSQ
jgi:GNAT superfamily N-acetyltransferase